VTFLSVARVVKTRFGKTQTDIWQLLTNEGPSFRASRLARQ
jgi:hypothetical protein